MRQNVSVSPVLEDSEDLMNDDQDNSQSWDIEDMEENGSNGEYLTILLIYLYREVM